MTNRWLPYHRVTFLLAAACTEPPTSEPETHPIIETIAGENSDRAGFADGLGTAARFAAPEGLALDAAGRYLYIADSNNHTIRRLEVATHEVITVAGVGGEHGAGDGDLSSPARFDTPRNLALSSDGATLFVTDVGNYVIRSIDIASPSFTVTTSFGTATIPGSSDGVGLAAQFGRTGFTTPWTGGLAIDGDTLYVADSGNQTIRQIDLVTREVVTIAGIVGMAGARDGDAAQALFHKPAGLLADRGAVWITEANNIDVRLLDRGKVSTLAGNAPDDPRLFCENISPELPPECGWLDAPVGVDARFRFPFGVTSDGAGGMFVVDSHSNVIRHVDLETTAVTTVAGVASELLDDIPRASTDSTELAPGTFSHPTHVAFAPPDTLFVSDRSANCIRRVVLEP